MARQSCRAQLLAAVAAVMAAAAALEQRCFLTGFLRCSAGSSIPMGGQGDSHQNNQGSHFTTRMKAVGCVSLLAGGASVSSQSRRRKVKRILRKALDAACHTIVQMTPAGRHLGQMLPPTPMFSAIANKLLMKKADELETIEEGTMEESCFAQTSIREPIKLPMLVKFSAEGPQARECSDDRFRAIQKTNTDTDITNDDLSPIRKQRNKRKMKSLHGWTPVPLEPMWEPESETSTKQGTQIAKNDSFLCASKFSSNGSGSEDGSVPSVLELGRIFNRLTKLESDGILRQYAMEKAIEELNERYNCGFNASDAPRLHTFLSKGGRNISREDFTTGMEDLLQGLHAVRHQLSLQQLRVVMASAFERFDENGDGSICAEEFAAALQASDIFLGQNQIYVLHRFLAQTAESKEACAQQTPAFDRSNLRAPEKSISLEEQCKAAIDGAVKNLARATGWNGATEMATRVAKAVSLPGSPKTRASRGLAAALGSDQETAGHVADVAELAASVAGAAFVLLHVHLAGPEAGMSSPDMLGPMSSTAHSLASAMGDLLQEGPMGPLLLSGLLGAAKALPSSDLGAMDHNEALLFARTFHDRGCSQALFHKLLACGSFRWASAEAGESLTAAPDGRELRILVRGKGLVQRGGSGFEEVPHGSTISTNHYSQAAGDASKLDIVAADQVQYVAWDLQKLQDYLANAHDDRLTDLVQQLKDDAKFLALNHGLQNPGTPCHIRSSPKGSSKGKCHSPGRMIGGNFQNGHIGIGSSAGWLSPVRAAMACQARRKGLSRCSQLSNDLQHVLSKPTASWSERLDQCKALIWDSADELMESLEAAVDLASACSVLAALAGSSAEMSPDDLLQLAPLLIMLSLTGAQAARKGITDLAA
eukprot:TRINITY_DN20590_c0_g1_i1.p1 TRINITY_DN20590_c0_g1~~TRINITY_DN20590_c0_g1_i1.p1  ORF type:complete len:887 (-),score=161.66 TRINITY_DN20590_c0_g1_i1:323-2956(-)